MNIYACWHQGKTGYCFEHPRSGWWFVPELGQPDSAVRRHLSFEEFTFASSFDWQLEYHRQQARAVTPRWRLYLRALFTPVRPNTVAGLLVASGASLTRVSGRSQSRSAAIYPDLSRSGRPALFICLPSAM